MGLKKDTIKSLWGCPNCGKVPVEDGFTDEDGRVLIVVCQVCGHQCTPAQCIEILIENGHEYGLGGKHE